MIDWTALKKDGRIIEHSISQRVKFPFLRNFLEGVIVGAHNKDRVWVQLDDGAQHLVDRNELTFVEGN